MAKQPVPELGPGWEYDDDPPDPGTDSERAQRWRVDWAKAQGQGHFMENGKKKYYQLIRVRN